MNQELEQETYKAIAADMTPMPKKSARDNRTLKEGEAAEVRTIRHLRSHAELDEDREYAEKVYQSMILELWIQHIVETGETYYGPMSEDLFEAYQLYDDMQAR